MNFKWELNYCENYYCKMTGHRERQAIFDLNFCHLAAKTTKTSPVEIKIQSDWTSATTTTTTTKTMNKLHTEFFFNFLSHELNFNYIFLRHFFVLLLHIKTLTSLAQLIIFLLTKVMNLICFNNRLVALFEYWLHNVCSLVKYRWNIYEGNKIKSIVFSINWA